MPCVRQPISGFLLPLCQLYLSEDHSIAFLAIRKPIKKTNRSTITQFRFQCLYHISISTITQLVCVAEAQTYDRLAINLIICLIIIVHGGRIGGLATLVPESANVCSVLGLDESILQNLFRLNLDVVFRLLGFPLSLSLGVPEEKQLVPILPLDIRLG